MQFSSSFILEKAWLCQICSGARGPRSNGRQSFPPPPPDLKQTHGLLSCEDRMCGPLGKAEAGFPALARRDQQHRRRGARLPQGSLHKALSPPFLALLLAQRACTKSCLAWQQPCPVLELSAQLLHAVPPGQRQERPPWRDLWVCC